MIFFLVSFAGPRLCGCFWEASCYVFPPFSPHNLASSSYSSLFLVMILSEQQLMQPSLQSLLLYWLGEKLNIFLCTFLLNKDLLRSALCACVSLHTPCLLVCSNRKLLALEPTISQTLGSSLSFEGKVGFAVVFTGTIILSQVFLSQGRLWSG